MSPHRSKDSSFIQLSSKFSVSKMSSISVRSEDKLEGASNFNVWKLRIMNILQELELDHFMTTLVEEPTTNVGSVAFKRNKSKAKRVIFYSVRDSIMSVLTALMTEK